MGYVPCLLVSGLPKTDDPYRDRMNMLPNWNLIYYIDYDCISHWDLSDDSDKITKIYLKYGSFVPLYVLKRSLDVYQNLSLNPNKISVKIDFETNESIGSSDKFVLLVKHPRDSNYRIYGLESGLKMSEHNDLLKFEGISDKYAPIIESIPI